SLDTSTHLDPIFDFIEQNCDTLKELYIALKAEWHIVVCINIRDNGSPRVVLSSRQISLANAIEVNIGFDIYALISPDEWCWSISDSV
ncbi:MAG: DUF4279 domain-containing protein, partial [Clostridiales bacterium]|nr:DUF4279 domain-containing protein [Clostridiales bacterium]